MAEPKLGFTQIGEGSGVVYVDGIAFPGAVGFGPDGVVRFALVPGSVPNTLEFAHTTGWEMSPFDRQLAECLDGTKTADEQADMSDVNSAWKRLAEEIGFDGVMNDLAVVWTGPESADMGGGELLKRVRGIVGSLESRGYPHTAIAVMGADLPRELEDEIFEAGAQVINVPTAFYELDLARRRAFVRSLFLPSGERPKVAVPKPNPDADRAAYIARNPDLSEDEVTEWWNRLASR